MVTTTNDVFIFIAITAMAYLVLAASFPYWVAIPLSPIIGGGFTAAINNKTKGT